MNTLPAPPTITPAPGGVGRAAARATTTLRQTVAQPRVRILLADDEPQLRAVGKLTLARSGYEVDTARDGTEAWVALHDKTYNLLITDYDMPGLTGLELIVQARRAGMRLPVVMISGCRNHEQELAGLRADLVTFLPKPFASDTLVETVERTFRAANNLPQCAGALISTLERIARSIQPYPHGGINE